MDIKAQIEELVKKFTSDTELKALFAKNPVQAVEKALGGVKLPTDQLDKIVAGVKAKLAGDKLADAAGALKGLLGKQVPNKQKNPPR